MRIEHKNHLPSYLRDWLSSLNVRASVERKPSVALAVPQELESLTRHELNLCLMLELFDERLARFERSLSGRRVDCDYGAYSEAMAFLDAVYLFSRMLFDSTAGIVRYMHKWDTKCGELPKSFSSMFKKAVKGKLPNNLNAVFSTCEAWFPQLKDRRDDIVHHYETYFIGFERDSAGRGVAIQFSPRDKTEAIANENLRSYIGTVMAGYQGVVDRLLDYWDERLRGSHDISVPRWRPILCGRAGNILWWAYRYGGYRNANLFIDETESFPYGTATDNAGQ
jgi:hypothetical protein